MGVFAGDNGELCIHLVPKYGHRRVRPNDIDHPNVKVNNEGHPGGQIG